MQPRQDIRFCATSDGVQLAMALYGRGPPLVRASTWLTHIERDPASWHNQAWIEELGRDHQYVTYDMRGCGLSSRQVDDVSFEAWLRDLETVVDSLGFERFPLLGISQGAALSIAYAVRHPERVSRMVLFGGFPSSYFSAYNADPRVAEEGEMLLKLTELGWGRASPAFRRVFVAKFFPHATPQLQDEFDAYSKLSAEPAMAARCLRAMYSINVRELAKQVRCPVLVMHATRDQLASFEQGRKLAALIPGARLVPLDCDNHVPLPEDACWPQVVREMREFLGDGVAPIKVKLTDRQQQVLKRVAAGRTDKEIARELALSPRTVEMHVAAAMKSLACGTRAEAVAKATAAGALGA